MITIFFFLRHVHICTTNDRKKGNQQQKNCILIKVSLLNLEVGQGGVGQSRLGQGRAGGGVVWKGGTGQGETCQVGVVRRGSRGSRDRAGYGRIGTEQGNME